MHSLTETILTVIVFYTVILLAILPIIEVTLQAITYSTIS